MNCTTHSRVELVLFDRLAHDLEAVDTLLGFALVKLDGTPIPAVPVYRDLGHRLVVAIPVVSAEYAIPWEVQRHVARLVRRQVRRLERAP